MTKQLRNLQTCFAQTTQRVKTKQVVRAGVSDVETSSLPPTWLTLRGRFPLNEGAADKIRDYRADYNNRPSNTISFMPSVASTSGRLHRELVRIVFLQAYRETDRFLLRQEFSLHNPTSSITVAWCCPHSSSRKSGTFSPRLQHCVSI